MNKKIISYLMVLMLISLSLFVSPSPAQALERSVSVVNCGETDPIVIDPIVVDSEGNPVNLESITINLTCLASKCTDCVGRPGGSVIDFETLPNGETPIDNSELVDAYDDGETKITFGFDLDDDLTIDLNARLESRLESGNKFAYTHSNGGQSKRDLDRTEDQEGGNWLLRAPRSEEIPQGKSFNLYNGDTFLVVYDGKLNNSVSGQLWDLDNEEQYKVEAIDESGQVIKTFTTPVIPDGEGPKTYSGLPTTFFFNAVPRPIKTLRFSGFKPRGGNGGFAFDNFSAKYVCSEVASD